MSSDLPENLQVIKLEPTSPTTSEDIPSHNIKAKLNLHVKRRLQDFTGQHNRNDNEYLHESYSHEHPQSRSRATIKLEQNSNQTNKEQVRQKRPYHKRTDKSKSTAAVTVLQQLSTEGTTPSPQRKYKAKHKTVVATGNPNTLTPNSQDDTSSHATTSLIAGAVSAGEEDEAGGHDDMRPGREKAKCPDVLAMVLSMKKRALMQDPEVQQFLSEVMQVIKS